jgi:SPOR domain
MSDPAARQRPMINLDEFERRLGRQATPSSRDGEDPLIELARLVGSTEDRYKAVFQGRPAASAAPRYPAEPQQTSEPIARRRRLGGDFAAIEAGLRGTSAPEFPAAPEPAFHGDPESSEADTDDWLDSPYLPPPPVVESPRSRLPLYATAAIIIAGMAGIGASFALKHHTVAPREIAMIKAEQGPTKIPVSETADTPKPQEVSVLDSSPQIPVAAVSHSEEPANLGAAPQAPAAPQASAATAPQASTSPTQAAPSPAAVVPVPAPPAVEGQNQAFGLSGMIEPKKVKTVVVRPDGTIMSSDTPQEPSVAAAAQPMPTVAPPQEAPPVLPVGPGPVPVDTAASSAKTTERVAAESPSVDTAPASADTASATPAVPAAPVAPTAHSEQSKPVAVAETEATDSGAQAGAHGFAVQLAAPQTEAEARQSLAKLQKEYGAEIAGHRLKYHRATVANKSVFRVRVIGLSHEEATALCKKVQAKGGGCFVARND